MAEATPGLMDIVGFIADAIGKGQALAMFVAAENMDAPHALRIGLIDAIAEDPVAEACRRIPK